MIWARLFSASTPVSPTTAAIAPNAPIGASHMIIDRTLKTSFWKMPIALRTGAEGLHGEADEQCHEQRLEHRVAGQWGQQRGGDEAEQEVGSALAGGTGR